jgi:hypothetical protein
MRNAAAGVALLVDNDRFVTAARTSSKLVFPHRFSGELINNRGQIRNSLKQ